MASRSDKSKSFLREQDFIGISNEEDEEDDGFYIDSKGVKKESHLDLEEVFKKNTNGKIVLKKSTILKITADKGMNRQVIVNAVNLQDYSKRQIKEIIKKLTEELKNNKIKGVLEFHANDTTQSSYHFHFWTWEKYEIKARAVLTDFMVENNYATYMNVKIEGEFQARIKKDSTKEEKEEVKKENRESKIDQNSESFRYKVDSKTKTKEERFRILKTALETKKDSIDEEVKKELPQKKEDIFSKLLRQAKKQKDSVNSPTSFGIISKKEDSLFKADTSIEELEEKIKALKSKLKSSNK